MAALILKRASASRPSGEWKDDDYDVLADGVVVGRIFNAAASPVSTPWIWTLLSREAAMAPFAKSWRRGQARHAPFLRQPQRCLLRQLLNPTESSGCVSNTP
jgi:hypothetical protein